MLNKKNLAIAIAVVLLTACSSPKNAVDINSVERNSTEKNLVQSLQQLFKQQIADPDNIELKSRQQVITSLLVNIYIKQAEQALQSSNYALASQIWQRVLTYQPSNTRAIQGLKRINSYRSLDGSYQMAVKLADYDPEKALQKIQLVLEEEPNWPQAKELRDFLLRKLSNSKTPNERMSAELRKPISLNFRSHNLIDIFNTIAQLTGVSFIFDNDVSNSRNGSIIARNTTAEDAINLLLLANQLRKKVLNGNTLLIYPANQSKDKTYRDIEVKTFFLGFAKAKDINVALRNLLKIRDIHVDERTNTITIRAPSEIVDMAERLLMTIDRPEAEVTLDVQVLEVFSKDAQELGLSYPDQIGVGLGKWSKSGLTTDASSSDIALADFNMKNLYINLGKSRGISVNLNQLISKSKVLANPRIRVENGKKAEISIGDKIPVVTSSKSEWGNTSKVEYNDVGLKLAVTPAISVDGTISMDVDFSLSNLGAAEKSAEGNIYYRTSNRAAKTILSSQDGETQVLAGLIKQNENESKQGLPWLSSLPLVGYLFGSIDNSKERTEVILLITPHIDHNLDLPGSHISTIPAGTEEMPGRKTLVLYSDGQVKLNAAKLPLPPLAPLAQMPGSLPDVINGVSR